MLGSGHALQRETRLPAQARYPAAAFARASPSATPGAIKPHAPTVGANKTGLTPNPTPGSYVPMKLRIDLAMFGHSLATHTREPHPCYGHLQPSIDRSPP